MTRVTITVGNQVSGSTVQTASYTSTMVWTPSTVVTELGAADREF